MKQKTLIKIGSRYEKVTPKSKAARYAELAEGHEERMKVIEQIGDQVTKKRVFPRREYYLVFGKKQYIMSAAEKAIAVNAGHTIYME